MHRLFLFFLCLFLTSCSTVNYKFTSTDSAHVRNLFSTNNINPSLYLDVKSDDYALPTEEWIKKEFVPFFRKFIFDYNLGWFEENSNDCTQYTQYALTCANLAFFQDKNRLKYHSLGVGHFSYIYGIERHLLIIFIAQDDKFIFFEPQTQEFVTLDDEDLRLCLEVVMN